MRVVRREDIWKQWIGAFNKKKLSFEVIKNGNYYSLQPPEGAYSKELIVYHHKDKKKPEEKINGKHLISILRKAVENFKGEIPTGLSEPNNYKVNNNAFMELDYYVLLDLNSAYWTACWKLGYLTQLQYVMGMEEDWKMGCVSAVGCLKRSIYKDVYSDGVLESENIRLNPDDRYSNARLHIINYVADIMTHCASLAGDDKWVFIHTDAICLHPTANRKDIVKYLNSIGFQFKVEAIEMLNFNKSFFEYNNKAKNKNFKYFFSI